MNQVMNYSLKGTVFMADGFADTLCIVDIKLKIFSFFIIHCIHCVVYIMTEDLVS